MNTIELYNQEIKIVFDNCETVLVDMWAIEALRFNTRGERYCWDRDHKNLLKSIELLDLYLSVNICETKYFHHTNRLIEKERVKDDGSQCIDRLRYCDDITYIYINSICYHVPWGFAPITSDIGSVTCYKNSYQKNTESKNSSGHNILTIEIKKE